MFLTRFNLSWDTKAHCSFCCSAATSSSSSSLSCRIHQFLYQFQCFSSVYFCDFLHVIFFYLSLVFKQTAEKHRVTYLRNGHLFNKKCHDECGLWCYDVCLCPAGKHTASTHRLSALVTPAGRSYVCAAQQTLTLISTDHQKGVTVSLYDIQVQAFDIQSDFIFSERKRMSKHTNEHTHVQTSWTFHPDSRRRADVSPASVGAWDGRMSSCEISSSAQREFMWVLAFSTYIWFVCSANRELKVIWMTPSYWLWGFTAVSN